VLLLGDDDQRCTALAALVEGRGTPVTWRPLRRSSLEAHEREGRAGLSDLRAVIIDAAGESGPALDMLDTLRMRSARLPVLLLMRRLAAPTSWRVGANLVVEGDVAFDELARLMDRLVAGAR
jgi:hypothetical protein